MKAAAIAVAALLLGGAAHSPRLAGCALFPADNPWNTRVDPLPVASNTRAIVAGVGLHPDFGSGRWAGGPIGIPYDVVDGTTIEKWTKPTFRYAGESDPGPYPIPTKVHVEHGSDRHALIVDTSTCRLYELFALEGKRAGSGATWSMRSNALRPAGWTSADAAGLPILPGLARYDEVAAGSIDHALRFTVQRSRKAYVYPARHSAGTLTDPRLSPMGLRLRLEASFDTSGFPRKARVVLTALKRYGMMVADNGSSWHISGAPNPGWNNDELHTLGRVKGSDFEVVDPAALRP